MDNPVSPPLDLRDLPAPEPLMRALAAVDALAAKIIKGGSGVWGAIPMPANPQVSEADSKKLAAWVLSQK